MAEQESNDATTHRLKSVSYRHFHCTNTACFRADSCEIPFVKTPANSMNELHNQLIIYLDGILDKYSLNLSRHYREYLLNG